MEMFYFMTFLYAIHKYNIVFFLFVFHSFVEFVVVVAVIGV